MSKRDAETRRNAVSALAHLVDTLGLEAPGTDGMTWGEWQLAWVHVLASCHDYCTDSRGDVGSWVRRAAIDALEAMLRKALLDPTAHPNLLTVVGLGWAAADWAGTKASGVR